MKYITILGITFGIIFFIIALNLNDYHSRTQNIEKSNIAESIAAAEQEEKSKNTELNMWDKVNNAKEKLQTTIQDNNEENAYSIITDENGEISGYQEIENIIYDEEGNVISFDKVGSIITPEEYAQITTIPDEVTEEATTKRPIPNINKNKTEERMTIVVE